MSLRAGIVVLIVAAMLLGALPALAEGPLATGPGDAVVLSGVQGGQLSTGQDSWYQMWEGGTGKPFGVTLHFDPAPLPQDTRNNPLVTFEVWTFQKQGLDFELVQIGKGTQGSQPTGIMYWSGGSVIARNYYFRVYNNSPFTVKYGIAATGSQFPPPALDIPEGSSTTPPAVTPAPAVPAVPAAAPAGTKPGGKSIEDAVTIDGVMSGIITTEHMWYKFYQPVGGQSTGIVLNFEPATLETLDQVMMVSFKVWALKCPVIGGADAMMVTSSSSCGWQVIGRGTRSGQTIGVNYWRHTAPAGTYYIEVFNNSGKPAGFALANTGDDYPPLRYPVPLP